MPNPTETAVSPSRPGTAPSGSAGGSLRSLPPAGGAASLVSEQYFRSGSCVECHGSAERLRTFHGPSVQDVRQQWAFWRDSPLRHRRCER